MNDKYSEIKRLDFEDVLWGIFVILSILNIIANDNRKKYIVSDNHIYEEDANKISICVLSILVLIYIYFFVRNYNMYNNKDHPTESDFIKLIGSLFFIIGTLCLLYFQVNSDDNFIGSPEI